MARAGSPLSRTGALLALALGVLFVGSAPAGGFAVKRYDIGHLR